MAARALRPGSGAPACPRARDRRRRVRLTQRGGSKREVAQRGSRAPRRPAVRRHSAQPPRQRRLPGRGQAGRHRPQHEPRVGSARDPPPHRRAATIVRAGARTAVWERLGPHRGLARARPPRLGARRSQPRRGGSGGRALAVLESRRRVSDWDAIVVGAGICGLAAAYELTRRDKRVLVLDAEGVGAGQSAGLARIFRIAHADPRLCALALEAERGWRRWERELGLRLLGREGLVAAGPERAESYAAAMEAAGARSEPLGRAAIAARIPLVAPEHPWDVGLWDPLAGGLRIRRTLQALAHTVTVRRATVVALEGGDEAIVHLDGDDALRAPAVLVCAGLGTGRLVTALGLDVEVEATHHVRLTYRAGASAPAACLIAPEAYGLPIGSTGRFALGMRDDGDGLPLDTVDAGTAAAAVRRQHAAWVPEVFPRLDPEPVDEVRCVALSAGWLDETGDGFAAERSGPVIAFGASNVMKFGPLVGERLAETVLDEELGVHPDLERRRR